MSWSLTHHGTAQRVMLSTSEVYDSIQENIGGLGYSEYANL